MARLIRAELPDPYQLVVRFRKSRDKPFLAWLAAQEVGQISELVRRRLNELAARGELGGMLAANDGEPQPAPAAPATPPPAAANDTSAKAAGSARLNSRLTRLMRNDDALTKDASNG
jgi:hypothetical protein